MTEPSKGDYEHQQPSADNKGKSSLFIKKEDQLVENRAPAEALMDAKIVVTEKVVVKEEEAKVQQRIPITILSEEEGYLLEGDELTVHTESRVDTHRECYSQQDKTERLKKRKTKVKAMELAIVRNQGRTLKMVKDLAPG